MRLPLSGCILHILDFHLDFSEQAELATLRAGNSEAADHHPGLGTGRSAAGEQREGQRTAERHGELLGATSSGFCRRPRAAGCWARLGRAAHAS